MADKPTRFTPLASSIGYGEPVRIDETTTLVPVSRLSFRGRAVPLGVFTITNGASTWTPVVDGGRVALIGVVTGLIAATLGSLAVLKQPPWPRMIIHSEPDSEVLHRA